MSDELKVPFTPVNLTGGRAVIDPHGASIEHPLGNGFSVTLEGLACFAGAVEQAHISFTLKLKKGDEVHKESCIGMEPFTQFSDKSQFLYLHEIVFGSTALVPGFAGKGVAKPERGWLPAFLLLKIEPAREGA